MFLSRSKQNNVYPCKPQFCYIKVGFKGVETILACFRDARAYAHDKIPVYPGKPFSVKGDFTLRSYTVVPSNSIHYFRKCQRKA